MYSRMLTGAIDAATGVMFTKASKKSGFGQVFQNNMDNSSFSGNTEEQIESILANSQYAYFNSRGTMRKTDAYKNCKVLLTNLSKIVAVINYLYATYYINISD